MEGKTDITILIEQVTTTEDTQAKRPFLPKTPRSRAKRPLLLETPKSQFCRSLPYDDPRWRCPWLKTRFKMAASGFPRSVARPHRGHAHFRLLVPGMAVLGCLLSSK